MQSIKSASTCLSFVSFVSLLILASSALSVLRADDAPMIEVGNTGFPVQITLNRAEVTARYQLVTNPDGTNKVSTDQTRLLMDVSIYFFKGKVILNLQGSTGKNFTGSFDSFFGTGTTQDPNYDMNLRRMSLVYRPSSGIDLSFGSFAPEYGSGSEDSYFDADGYIMGYRGKVMIVNGTELVVTGGYLGDFETPDVTQRMERLVEFNYLQAMITQSIGEIVRTSLEYNYIANHSYVRGALKIDTTKWVKFLDSIVVEDMTRLNGNDRASIYSAKIVKQFKGVFGSVLPGRDLQVIMSYIYEDSNLDLPVGDHIFKGSQLRFQLTVPNFFKLGIAKVGVFFDYIKSLTELEQFRLRAGVFLKI